MKTNKGLSIIITGLTALLLSAPLHAATFTVTKVADTADGTCNADCSLREAVIAANFAGLANTITLPAGTYILTLPGVCENAAATGDLDIINGTLGSDITINGSATGASIIDGNGTDRVFHIPLITSASSLTLNNVTVRNGDAATCTAGDSLGGGIRLDQGDATLNNATVSGNNANDRGGGIYAGGFGSSVLAINSTISGNTSANGGGIAVDNMSSVDLRNVTATDNTASGDGGGVYAQASSSFIGDHLTVRNTIIAGNTDSSAAPNDHPDCSLNNAGFSPQLATEGFNLIGDDTGCKGEFGGNDQFGTAATPIDPQLGPLADNGGPTLTHALLVASTAIDGGNNVQGCTSDDAQTTVLTSDQRAFVRPVDGDLDGVTRCDIGAYEFATLPFCGDGTVDPGEGCDDGNLVDGDGCSSKCAVETACGDGTVDTGEGCDDGNLVDGDGCSSKCALEVCGDGIVQGLEKCDDGNTVSGDGCSSTCTFELMFLLGDGGCTLIKAEVAASKEDLSPFVVMLLAALISYFVSVPLRRP